MYPLLRKILFLFDAESVHYFTMNSLKALCRIPGVKQLISRTFSPIDKPVTAFGLLFKNPVGLAAGFDKNAKYLSELSALGFGFIEIGTVTPRPQKGNPRPRLFRLPKDKAIINRMGFNNDGVEAVVERLTQFRQNKRDLIIGGNIGKNKDTKNEDAWLDYEKCFLALYDVVDYFVVNVSSPNTPGLRDLQQIKSLRKILTHLQQLREKKKEGRPILLKIAPDLNDEDIIDIINLAAEIDLDGLVISNTTISRDGLISSAKTIAAIGAGGLSGKPLFEKSNYVLKKVHDHSSGSIPLIASGGIGSGVDAGKKFEAGAKLVQVYTGFIYRGPGIVKAIVASAPTR